VIGTSRSPRRKIGETASRYCARLLRHRFERSGGRLQSSFPYMPYSMLGCESFLNASPRAVRQLSPCLDRTVFGAERRVAELLERQFRRGPVR
jgi:hypothetical protein